MKERVMDKILFRDMDLGPVKLRLVDVLFILCLMVLGFMLRCELFPIESADYWGFLKEWMKEIRANGGFHSLKLEISNYSSPYMYIMCALSYFVKNDLYGLKLVSVFFDYVAAFTMFFMVYHLTGKRTKAVFSMAAVLLCPTVVINGAYWCQCDIIYVSFLLLALYALFKEKGSRCLLFVGLAFSFKVQALFLVPFLIILWLKDQTVKLRHFLWIPAIYILSALPAWMMGRDFKELMTVYTDQAGTYPWGTLEYPNIYALLGEAQPELHYADEVSGAGVFMTILVLGLLAYFMYTRNIRMNYELKVTLALFTAAVTVYCLPHMHERYGLLVDVLAILYGVLNVKRLPAACGFIVTSLLSYMPYLTVTHIVPIAYAALALLGLILYVGYDLYRQTAAATIPVSSPEEAADEIPIHGQWEDRILPERKE